MYSPVQPGISNSFKDDVTYNELPSLKHSRIVYCYWELRTNQPLDSDFIYEVLPDGCVDIVFESGKIKSGIVMTPAGKIEQINLGKSFRYVGIRLNIGYWKHSSQVINKQVPLNKFAVLECCDLSDPLINKDSVGTMDEMIDALIVVGCINKNPLSAVLQAHVNELRSVEDMIRVSGYSRRQLQRIVKEETGFSPKELLDVIRFQSALSCADDGWRYSDQAHVNRDFKRRTGVTPKGFMSKFSRSMAEIFNRRG